MSTFDDDQNDMRDDSPPPERRSEESAHDGPQLSGDAPEGGMPSYDDYDDEMHRQFEMADPHPPSELDPIIDEEEFEEEESGREMGFFEHLEELRWRIIKALIALAGGALICAIYLEEIIQGIILGPANRLTPPLKMQNTEPMGQVTLAIQVALISGLIVGIPFIIWQFWGFIKPGLYEKEKKMASWIAVATIFCFLLGISFAYFVMIPASLQFTSSFIFEGIENRFTISAYFSFVLGFILACGVVFEMPMVSYALARFGIVTPEFLRRYRRHAMIVILIAAAIITPTPDPFNQLLLAVPLYALYEVSIVVARAAMRSRREAE